MIKYTSGNLLEADVEAIVNTVNCVGVMGKGIALQFKQAFPKNFDEYKRACNLQQVRPGEMFTVTTGSFFNPKYIVNFPTKRHWKGKSRLEDIVSGLRALREELLKLNIQSIAIPPLGCGNGGLDWYVVRPLIVETLHDLPVNVYIYEPNGSPEPDQVKIGTEKPKLTRARAILVSLMDIYGMPGYKLSLLEIQKLAYFLQVVGEPLKLNFTKQRYGPYAENLNHVLQRLEGHYIRGYGDRNRDSEIYTNPIAMDEAKEFLNSEPSAAERLERVSEIIQGFETPYGMELLSTVHWVMSHEDSAFLSIEDTIKSVHDWNDRKKEVMQPGHIRIAWEHLKETVFR